MISASLRNDIPPEDETSFIHHFSDFVGSASPVSTLLSISYQLVLMRNIMRRFALVWQALMTVMVLSAHNSCICFEELSFAGGKQEFLYVPNFNSDFCNKHEKSMRSAINFENIALRHSIECSLMPLTYQLERVH